MLALGAALVTTRARAQAPPTASAREGSQANAEPTNEPDEVVVHGTRSEEETITRAEAREVPGAFGDPLRAIEMQPGIAPIATGLPYFYLRGAPPGNIGYFLDGVRVPTLYHLALGPSVVHPSLVESVALYPGPYPARYGRFGAGVVTAETAPPATELGGDASVRLVDAGAFVKAPFADYRGSVAIGGRYSYTSAILSLIVPELEVSYWDYQALASYDVTPDDTIGILSFGASDFLSEARASGVSPLYDTEFHRLDLRYDRRLGGGATLRVAGTVGADHSTLQAGQIIVDSETLAFRTELSLPLGRNARFRAGADVELARYAATVDEDPASNLAPGVLEFTAARFGLHDDVTSGVWLDAELVVAPGIRLAPGVRVDVFVSDDTTLVGVDPRIQAEFDLSRTLTVTQGVGIVHQRPSFTIPLAGLQPVTDHLQKSVQASSGVRLKLPEDVSASATAYGALHLDLSDPIAASRSGGGDPFIGPPLRWLGRSYGLELMLRRGLTRKLGGYLAYTLSRSQRSIERRSEPAPYDRAHVVSGAVAYDLGRSWRAGARASFYTGFPMEVAYIEAASDPPRSSPFFRLDWRLEKTWPMGDGTISFVVEVLNTTFQREELRGGCSAHVCKSEVIGPVTVPSLGVEAAL